MSSAVTARHVIHIYSDTQTGRLGGCALPTLWPNPGRDKRLAPEPFPVTSYGPQNAPVSPAIKVGRRNVVLTKWTDSLDALCAFIFQNDLEKLCCCSTGVNMHKHPPPPPHTHTEPLIGIIMKGGHVRSCWVPHWRGVMPNDLGRGGSWAWHHSFLSSNCFFSFSSFQIFSNHSFLLLTNKENM